MTEAYVLITQYPDPDPVRLFVLPSREEAQELVELAEELFDGVRTIELESGRSLLRGLRDSVRD